MRRVLTIIVGLLFLPLFLYLLYGAILWGLGYEFAKGPDVLAEELVREERPARDCFLYRTLDLGPRPTTYELQMECVYTYAELTKDPTACEMLMPGEYALSCIGAGSVSEPCFLKIDRSVRWNNHGGEATLKECLEEKQASKEGQQCCTIARVNFLNGYDDCSSLADSPAFSDQCLGELAEKKLDPALCSNIQSENLRSACTIRVTALKKYPTLPRFPAIDVEDLTQE